VFVGLRFIAVDMVLSRDTSGDTPRNGSAAEHDRRARARFVLCLTRPRRGTGPPAVAGHLADEEWAASPRVRATESMVASHVVSSHSASTRSIRRARSDPERSIEL